MKSDTCDRRGDTETILTERRSGGQRTVGWAKVLLIEDDPFAARALARRLVGEGLHVVIAADGISGLEEVQLEEPDLILLDIHLPRLDGFRFLHWLRCQPGSWVKPVIALTGDLDPTIDERAERWGVAKVFRKPVSDRELVRAIRDSLLGYDFSAE